MIPIRLQLKNFLSYGDTQTIDFSPYSLICLSGKNGHGKSALLDAITWALWGQARKASTSSRPDQGLLKLGQSTMTVCLDFVFNGQEYRVRREFSVIQGKISTKIDFGIIDTGASNSNASSANTSGSPANNVSTHNVNASSSSSSNSDTGNSNAGNFTGERTSIDRDRLKVMPLSGKTSRETQETIERTLNLDFESFAHSSFLRQGQASEFSKKAPKERKDILAAILGLKKYDAIKQAALDKAREAQNEKGARAAVLEKSQQQLAQKSTVEEEYVTNQTLVTITRSALLELEQHQTKLTHEAQEISKQQRERAIISSHQERLEAQMLSLQKTFSDEAQLWRTTHRKLRTMADPAQIDRKRQTLLIAVTEQQEALQKQLTLKQELFELTMTISAREAALKQQHTESMATVTTTLERARAEQRDITHKLSLLATQLEKLERQKFELTRSLEQHKVALELRTTQSAQAHTIEEQFERRKAFYQRFSAQGKYLTSELNTLERKQHDLHDDGPSSCPLCEQNLSAARKRFLKTQTLEQHGALKRRLSRMSKALTRLKQLLIEQNDALVPLKKAREEASIIEARMKDTHEQCAVIERELQELIALKQTLGNQLKAATDSALKLTEACTAGTNVLAELIKKDEACVIARAKQSVLELLIKKTLYEKETHERALQELALLAKEQEYLAHLKQEAAQQISRKERISEVRSALRAHQQSLRAVEESLKQFLQLAELETAHAQRLATHRDETKLAQKRHEELLGEQARITLKRETIATLERDCSEELTRIATIDERIADYQAIALAVGKDGIQALIIEQALPEIESEANALLGRLTNNQAHVSIESLRDLKKGGAKETLDINISDSLGVRPYELYSGGEAFRIDFALRIAISKLLARRAGTSLQTLIIDEGFGSQDEEGLSKIMEAIYAIKDDFAMIIIVSHLTSMKDQFPVHLVVEKEPNGSRVHVFQQG